MASRIHHLITIPDQSVHGRLDQIIAELFPQYSRSLIQAWIQTGELKIDGEKRKASFKVLGGEQVHIDALSADLSDVPEAIPLTVIFEDRDLLVINKPAGLVVHPGAGNRQGTLLNALLHYHPPSAELPRAGIVHRLDKDTSGLMVVAKCAASRNELIRQLAERSVTRNYEAIVYGDPGRGGRINAPIGRLRTHRTKMGVVSGGKEAITMYRRLGLYREHTHLECSLLTGRTHQIRVHLQHLGFPLVGDPSYGGHFRQPKYADDQLIEAIRAFPRQALHARRLSLIHPRTGLQTSWEQPLPDDMSTLLAALKDNQHRTQ